MNVTWRACVYQPSWSVTRRVTVKDVESSVTPFLESLFSSNLSLLPAVTTADGRTEDTVYTESTVSQSAGGH